MYIALEFKKAGGNADLYTIAAHVVLCFAQDFVIYKLFMKTKSNTLLKSVTVREEHESTEEANEDEPIKIKKRK